MEWCETKGSVWRILPMEKDIIERAFVICATFSALQLYFFFLVLLLYFGKVIALPYVWHVLDPVSFSFVYHDSTQIVN
jgi:L-cystine uptake protein TcyP (sodium:dicarboxylate symporter family)